MNRGWERSKKMGSRRESQRERKEYDEKRAGSNAQDEEADGLKLTCETKKSIPSISTDE